MKTIITTLLILLSISAAAQNKDTTIEAPLLLYHDTTGVIPIVIKGRIALVGIVPCDTISFGSLIVGAVSSNLYLKRHKRKIPFTIRLAGQIRLVPDSMPVVVSGNIDGNILSILFGSLTFSDIFKPNQKTSFNIFL